MVTAAGSSEVGVAPLCDEVFSQLAQWLLHSVGDTSLLVVFHHPQDCSWKEDTIRVLNYNDDPTVRKKFREFFVSHTHRAKRRWISLDHLDHFIDKTILTFFVSSLNRLEPTCACPNISIRYSRISLQWLNQPSSPPHSGSVRRWTMEAGCTPIQRRISGRTVPSRDLFTGFLYSCTCWRDTLVSPRYKGCVYGSLHSDKWFSISKIKIYIAAYSKIWERLNTKRSALIPPLFLLCAVLHVFHEVVHLADIADAEHGPPTLLPF